MRIAPRYVIFVLCHITIFCFLNGPLAADQLRHEDDSNKQLRVVIQCARKILQLWYGPVLLREFPVEVGKGGIHKRRGGDHRTPIGDYEISWMASRHSDKGFKIVDGTSWCKGNKFFQGSTGPPLEKLWAESYGGDEASIMSINYPNDEDRARGFTGDCIHIHSDKHLIDGALTKSYGCIHMFPKDARDLYDRVDVGTPVKIFP